MSFWKHRGLSFYTVFAILHCGARFFSWLSTVQDMRYFWLSDECFIIYIYIIIYHTHHITVVSHETCLLSGPGYDDSLYFFYINRQESQPSNAWFWALHRMLWHLPRLRFRPAALGRLKMAQEWPEPYIGLSERWAKNPGVRSLRSLLGYSCTAMHCNYLGGIDFVFGKQKAINQHFATCTKATNTWPATR